MYFEAALKYPLTKVSGSLCDTDGIKQSSQISDLLKSLNMKYSSSDIIQDINNAP